MHLRNENVGHVQTDRMARGVFMEYHNHRCGIFRFVLRSHSWAYHSIAWIHLMLSCWMWLPSPAGQGHHGFTELCRNGLPRCHRGISCCNLSKSQWWQSWMLLNNWRTNRNALLPVSCWLKSTFLSCWSLSSLPVCGGVCEPFCKLCQLMGGQQLHQVLFKVQPNLHLHPSLKSLSPARGFVVQSVLQTVLLFSLLWRPARAKQNTKIALAPCQWTHL